MIKTINYIYKIKSKFVDFKEEKGFTIPVKLKKNMY